MKPKFLLLPGLIFIVELGHAQDSIDALIQKISSAKEHLTKEKMIEKNKAIRLAAAKKTIAKPEADKQ